MLRSGSGKSTNEWLTSEDSNYYIWARNWSPKCPGTKEKLKVCIFLFPGKRNTKIHWQRKCFQEMENILPGFTVVFMEAMLVTEWTRTSTTMLQRRRLHCSNRRFLCWWANKSDCVITINYSIIKSLQKSLFCTIWESVSKYTLFPGLTFAILIKVTMYLSQFHPASVLQTQGFRENLQLERACFLFSLLHFQKNTSCV